MSVETFNRTDLGTAAAVVVDNVIELRVFSDPETQWQHWLDALAGAVRPTPKGAAPSGFYRTRFNDAVAVWRDENRALQCLSSGAFSPKDPEKIDMLITGDGCRAITHEVYTAFVETGRWPDDIEEVEVDPGLAPHEAIMAEIRQLAESFDRFFASIGGSIETEEHNLIADKYAKRIAELGKRAETTRETLKRPHLEAGNAIQTAWKPVVDAAAATKKTILAPTDAFRKRRADEEKAAREAEIARQRAELERARAEAAKNNEPLPQAAPVSMPPPKPTGLRTFKVVEIFDLPALARQISTFNDPDADFVEVCRKIARRMCLAGASVEGARMVEEKRAS